MARQTGKQRSDLEAQAVALAEQLGRIAGTLERTADTWLNRQTLADELTRVRDGAAQMLAGLTAGAGGRGRAKGKPAKRAALPRRPADPSRAPGKRRRKPAPTLKGVKKSDQAIPKLRTAQAARQRRKTFA